MTEQEGVSYVLELLAIFISILVLIVSYHMAHLTREHNKLSVKPILSFGMDRDRVNMVFNIALNNIGVGPAIIKSFKITRNGNDSKHDDLIDLANVNTTNLCEIHSRPISADTAISKEASIEFFKINFKDRDKFDEFLESLIRDDWEFKAEYESIYGEGSKPATLKISS